MMNETFTLKIDQAELFGERSGQGKPLIFLHAGVADRRMWQAQMTDLSQNYQTVAYDRRGFGKTIAFDEAFSHVEDLGALMDNLGLERAALIGCSQGGRVAIDFALTYPYRVSALILIAPAISGAPAPDTRPLAIEGRLEALDQAEEADDLARINELEANLWLDGPTSVAGRVDETLRALFLDMNGIALEAPELTQEQEPASAYERLAELSMPVFVLWGDLDFPHVKERCHHLLKMIPSAQSEEIPGTAHLLNMEQPEKVNQMLQEFLITIQEATR